MKSVGIIGFGNFGRFLANKLDRVCEVRAYGRGHHTGKWDSDLAKVAGADYLILAVPLSDYRAALKEVKNYIKARTILVDVCSVKVEPVKVIRSVLPNQPVVATHPLFGPQSARDSLKGHTIVMCPEQSDPTGLEAVMGLCRDLDLDVVTMSADEHDREMATVHGLTFFIAHGLRDMGLHDQKLATPSFQKLLDLAILERQHSEGLFMTIQAGNVHAADVRSKFIKEVVALDRRLGAEGAGTPESHPLSRPRRHIDDIDRQIVGLLAERAEVVSEVARIKRTHNLAVEQSDRFRSMMERLRAEGSRLGLSPELVDDIWGSIHEDSKSQQVSEITK